MGFLNKIGDWIALKVLSVKIPNHSVTKEKRDPNYEVVYQCSDTSITNEEIESLKKYLSPKGIHLTVKKVSKSLYGGVCMFLVRKDMVVEAEKEIKNFLKL